jgi:hypothetical protein
MTKQVRIENADTSPFKVRIEVWQSGGYGPEGGPVLVKTIALDHPAQMATEYIHSSQWLVVREATPADETP